MLYKLYPFPCFLGFSLLSSNTQLLYSLIHSVVTRCDQGLLHAREYCVTQGPVGREPEESRVSLMNKFPGHQGSVSKAALGTEGMFSSVPCETRHRGPADPHGLCWRVHTVPRLSPPLIGRAHTGDKFKQLTQESRNGVSSTQDRKCGLYHLPDPLILPSLLFVAFCSFTIH